MWKKSWNVKCEYRPIWKCGSFDFLWRLALSQMIGFNGIWPNIKWSITQNHYQTEKALILIKMILQKIIWRRFKLVSAIASDELTMEPCCALKYYPAVDACQSEKVFLINFVFFSSFFSTEWKGFCHHSFSQHLYHHSLCYHSNLVLHYNKSWQDGDTETKRRAVEQAEEEDFGQTVRGQVNFFLGWVGLGWVGTNF